MEIIEVDPREVLFSQCCIRPKFKDGKIVENTIRMLVNERISPEEIELIRVCVLPNGKMHSLDNRRLYTFKEAIKRGAPFETVTVIFSKRRSELESLDWKMKNPPSKDWSVVKVKADCKPIFSVNVENVENTRIQNTAVNHSRPKDNHVLYTRTQNTAVNYSRPFSSHAENTRTQNTAVNLSRPLSSHAENTRTQNTTVNFSRPISSHKNNGLYTKTQDTAPSFSSPRDNYYVENTRTQNSVNLSRPNLSYSSYTRIQNTAARENYTIRIPDSSSHNYNRENRRRQDSCCVIS